MQQCDGFDRISNGVFSGYNSGRTYYLQLDSRNERDEAMEAMKGFVNSAKNNAEVSSRLLRAMVAARAIHSSLIFQALSALLIALVRTESRMWNTRR